MVYRLYRIVCRDRVYAIFTSLSNMIDIIVRCNMVKIILICDAITYI